MARITKQPDIRRQEIIDTALSLFCEKGYEGTSMLDISNKMNVSQGLCYRYFKSKEDIYAAALEQYVGEGVQLFRSMLGDTQKPIRAKLHDLLSLHNNSQSAGGGDFFNAPGNERFHTQMQMELCRRLCPIVAAELVRAQQRQEIVVENPQATAAFCLYGQLGIWLNAPAGRSDTMEETKKLISKLIG